MEPQVNLNCRRRENKICCCVDLILAILIAILAFIIGLSIVAFTGLATVLGVGAIVVITTILVILIIIRAIMLACREIKRC